MVVFVIVFIYFSGVVSAGKLHSMVDAVNPFAKTQEEKREEYQEKRADQKLERKQKLDVIYQTCVKENATDLSVFRCLRDVSYERKNHEICWYWLREQFLGKPDAYRNLTSNLQGTCYVFDRFSPRTNTPILASDILRIASSNQVYEYTSVLKDWDFIEFSSSDENRYACSDYEISPKEMYECIKRESKVYRRESVCNKMYDYWKKYHWTEKYKSIAPLVDMCKEERQKYMVEEYAIVQQLEDAWF